MLAATLSGCFWDDPEPATDAQLNARPFALDIRQPFQPYDAGRWTLLLLADKGDDRVTPTVEIEVHNVLKSGEFPPEKLLVEEWSELAPYGDLTMDAPKFAQLARSPAVHIRGTASDGNGNAVRIEQKVAKLPKGYARVLSFADAERYEELRPVINAIAASIWVE